MLESTIWMSLESQAGLHPPNIYEPDTEIAAAAVSELDRKAVIKSYSKNGGRVTSNRCCELFRRATLFERQNFFDDMRNVIFAKFQAP